MQACKCPTIRFRVCVAVMHTDKTSTAIVCVEQWCNLVHASKGNPLPVWLKLAVCSPACLCGSCPCPASEVTMGGGCINTLLVLYTLPAVQWEVTVQ